MIRHGPGQGQRQGHCDRGTKGGLFFYAMDIGLMVKGRWDAIMALETAKAGIWWASKYTTVSIDDMDSELTWPLHTATSAIQDLAFRSMFFTQYIKLQQHCLPSVQRTMDIC